MNKKLQPGKSMLLFLAFLISFSSCNKEDADLNIINGEGYGKYSNGIFIVNEGAFIGGVGTISFLDLESMEVEEDIFEKVNERPLGSVVQSMEVFNGKGYIVVNNAEKVEVVDSHDFKSVGEISGLQLPRYFIGVSDDKGYVSEWGEESVKGAIKVVDLKSFNIVKTIELGLTPGRMTLHEEKVYVVNNGSASVSLIDIGLDEVVATIDVKHSPNSLQIDSNSNLWVMCGGYKHYNSDWDFVEEESTAGSLFKINTTNNEIIKEFIFESKPSSPNHLTINEVGDKLYYGYSGSIYSISSSSETFVTSPFISKSFYGLSYFKDNNWLIGADAGDYSGKGKIYIYNANDGNEIGDYTVGIIPNGIAVQHP